MFNATFILCGLVPYNMDVLHFPPIRFDWRVYAARRTCIPIGPTVEHHSVSKIFQIICMECRTCLVSCYFTWVLKCIKMSNSNQDKCMLLIHDSNTILNCWQSESLFNEKIDVRNATLLENLNKIDILFIKLIQILCSELLLKFCI